MLGDLHFSFRRSLPLLILSTLTKNTKNLYIFRLLCSRATEVFFLRLVCIVFHGLFRLRKRHQMQKFVYVYLESGWLSGYLSSLPPLRAGVQLWPRPACGLSFSRSQPDSRVFLRVLRFSSLIKIDSQLINI